MKLFDTHAHLDDRQFDADREAVIEKIKNSGVARVIEVGSDVKSSETAVRIANGHDFIYCAAGIHPEAADDVSDADFKRIKELAIENPKVKAIGEIGIDYHYDDCAPREKQTACFERQLDLAAELGLPAIIHDRESKGDVLKILKEKNVSNAVMHCFSGSAETAKVLVKMGLMISFTGVITFKNARKAVEALKMIPLERLMIETDSPYMAPEPHRGRRNDSSYVRHVAEKMAEIKGVSFERLCDITYENAMRFFNID